MLLEVPPSPYDLNWRLLGLPVRVNPYFWLTALFTGLNLKDPADILTWVFCLFLSILLHELGHALTARFFGACNVRIILYWLGGLAIHDSGLSRGRRVFELLMGPGAGFLLYGAIVGASYAVDFETLPSRAQLALYMLVQINLYWGLVNLLIVYPLDGGQIARELILARRPYDGVLLSLRLSLACAVLVALGFLALHFTAWDMGLYPVFIFSALAVINYQLALPRNLEAQEESRERREPWERDPDWWKK